MKRQISVSIFLAVMVLVLAWLYIKLINETQSEKNLITTENDISKQDSITISQENISYPYYIKVVDGRLVVFFNQSHSVFMEPSIEKMLLPLDIQSDLEDVIYSQSEQKLYDFIESYSS